MEIKIICLWYIFITGSITLLIMFLQERKKREITFFYFLEMLFYSYVGGFIVLIIYFIQWLIEKGGNLWEKRKKK